MINSTKSIRYYAFQLLIVIAITLLLLEVIGLYIYYQQYGGIFYIEADRTEVTENRGITTDRVYKTKNVLHPFLGFVFRPSLPMSRVADSERLRRMLDGKKSESSWTTLKTNNHGFFSEFDYPYVKKNRRELIIGIFGGSVAQWFSLQAAERLKKELQDHPFFKGHDILVLNYSQGGFKQPQQVQTLSYFSAVGQKFDIIVNIDGFNEIALSHINHKKNVDTSMPSAQHLLPILGLMGSLDENLEILDKVHNLRQSEARLRRYKRWRSSTKSAGLHLILSVMHGRASNKYAAANQVIDSSSKSKRTKLVYLPTLPNDYAMSNSIRDILDSWLGASVTMQQICNTKNILYLEVIQPNQYFSKKEFSKREKMIAIDESSPYREAIRLGYQHLPDFVRRMRLEEVNVSSAVSIFDNVKEETFSDSCCHYNQIGNEIMAIKVAESITTLIGGRQFKKANSGK